METGHTNPQDFLAALWFQQTGPDDPVFLNLEDDSFLNHGINREEFQSLLIATVKQDLDMNKPSDLFYTLRRKLGRWRASGEQGYPPVLSILALTILAAKQMGHDDNFTAQAYYPRLAHMLGNPSLSAGLSQSFGSVVDMWIAVHQWIEGNEELGNSMISSLGGYARIGYPRSQALVAMRDHAKLAALKERIGESTFSQLSDSQILQEIRIWSRNSSRFSPAFERALELHDSDIEAYLVYAAKNAYINIGNEGKRPITELLAELWYDFEHEELSWVLPRREEALNFQGLNESGQELLAKSGYVQEILEARGFPEVTAASLRVSTIWRDGQLAVSIKPRLLWIFHETSAIDSVLSSDRLPADEKFSILFPTSINRQIIEMFKTEQIEERIKYELIPGWNFCADIFVGSRTDAFREILEMAGSPKPATYGARLVSLSGGLQIRTNSGLSTYIEGYEPDLQVRQSEQTFTLQIGGSDLAQTLKATDAGFPLSKLSFKPGETTILVSSENKKAIKTVDLTEAWDLAASKTQFAPKIQGLNFYGRIESRGRFYFAVLKDGSILEISHVGQPFWLVRRSLKTDFQNFRLEIPRECVWIIALHERNKPIVEIVSTHSITVDHTSILACQETWKAFISLSGRYEMSNINSLLLIVKAVI